MPTILDTTAKEGSTYSITITLTDSNDATISAGNITSINWTLTDNAGTNIINSREEVAVNPVANPATIVLSGADLDILAGETTEKTVGRRLVIQAVYDSDLGSDLNLVEEAVFLLENLTYV